MTSFYSDEELKNIGFKKIGVNVSLSRKASIYGADNIEIGDHVRIDDFCILSGKIKLGIYIHIAPYSALFGGVSGIEIEDFAGLSSRCVIYGDSDDYSGEAMTNPMIPNSYRHVTGGRVTLKRHVILGTGVSVLPNITVGEGTAIGSMSLVSKSLDPWGVYAGIPCKKLKDRKKDLLEKENALLEEKLSHDRKNN